MTEAVFLVRHTGTNDQAGALAIIENRREAAALAPEPRGRGRRLVRQIILIVVLQVLEHAPSLLLDLWLFWRRIRFGIDDRLQGFEIFQADPCGWSALDPILSAGI